MVGVVDATDAVAVGQDALEFMQPQLVQLRARLGFVDEYVCDGLDVADIVRGRVAAGVGMGAVAMPHSGGAVQVLRVEGDARGDDDLEALRAPTRNSICGGARAGAVGGGSAGSPTCSR